MLGWAITLVAYGTLATLTGLMIRVAIREQREGMTYSLFDNE